MASLSTALCSITLNRMHSCVSRSSLSLVSASSSSSSCSSFASVCVLSATRLPLSPLRISVEKSRETKYVCRAGESKFPDPIPEFADVEIEKFTAHLLKKLGRKKKLYGYSLDDVVGICTEIFSAFLHSKYCGPGTLVVSPFVDMADTINNRGLPGGLQAAEVALDWAHDNVNKDWKEWNGGQGN